MPSIWRLGDQTHANGFWEWFQSISQETQMQLTLGQFGVQAHLCFSIFHQGSLWAHWNFSSCWLRRNLEVCHCQCPLTGESCTNFLYRPKMVDIWTLQYQEWVLFMTRDGSRPSRRSGLYLSARALVDRNWWRCRDQESLSRLLSLFWKHPYHSNSYRLIHIQVELSDSVAPSSRSHHERFLHLAFPAWTSVWANHESDVCSSRDHVHDLLSLRQYIRSFLRAVYSPID